MAGFTFTDISSYAAQISSKGSTVKKFSAAAAAGDDTELAAAPGASKRILIERVVIDCDTAGEVIEIDDGDNTNLLNLRMPVSDTYIWNLNLECTVNKAVNWDKGAVAGVKGYVVYRTISSGDLVGGY